jgi:ribosome-associated protein
MKVDAFKNEFVFVAVRSRGPGGQNVNKVSSAAILLWDFNASRFLTGEQKGLIWNKLGGQINKEGQLYLRSDEFRDLEKNKNRCIEKLENLLSSAFFKPKKRRPTKPSKSSKKRRLESKTRHGETKRSRQKVW